MSFFAPVAFWFLGAIPVVVLFYMLKRKRVAQLVSSTLLWERFLAEMQASAPFQRLRHNWLLLLQILLLLLAILALSRPFYAGTAKGGRRVVVILDSSASMRSTDTAPSRFDAARAEAGKLVDALRDSDQMVLLLAGAQTEVRQSPTSDKTALRRALDACQPTDAEGRVREALQLAQSLTRNVAHSEIHLLSDGAVGDLTEFENKDLPLVYHKIGLRGRNLGFVNVDVRPNPENPMQRAVFANIANFSSEDQAVPIEFSFNGQMLEARTVTVKAKQTVPVAFTAVQTVPGVFEVAMDTEDDLAVDDVVSVVSRVPAPVRVLLISAGNRFMEKALRAAGNVELAVAPALVGNAEEFDLVVFDNLMPETWPEKNILAFGVHPAHWFDSAEALEGPAIVDWMGGHPLLRFVHFENVLIAASYGVKAPAWASPLLETSEHSLMAAGELGRQRIAWAGFDVLQTTWPLRVSFPIFIANAVDWLNPATVENERLTVKAGDPIRLALPRPTDEAQIRLPDGSTRQVEPGAQKLEVVFGETAQRGLYQLRAGEKEGTVAVNAVSVLESDNSPKEELVLGEYVTLADVQLRKANVEIWRWLAALGLAVLLGEWWYYHRRTA